jgi:hypothetical protein
VQEQLRRSVVEFVGVQRFHDRDFIRDFRQVRQQVGHLRAALAVTLELLP